MNDRQIEHEMEKLEAMPDDEFKKMCAWFEKQTRESIAARRKVGQATQSDLIWLLEHAA